MKTREVTLGSLKVGDVFMFGGVKFTVNDNSPSIKNPNDDYLLNVRIEESKKGCYISNCALVEVLDVDYGIIAVSNNLPHLLNAIKKTFT